LDRLARNVHFVNGLIETGVEFVAAKARGVVLSAAGASNLKPNIGQRQQAAGEFADKLRRCNRGNEGAWIISTRHA
jgi:hypothetical protein